MPQSQRIVFLLPCNLIDQAKVLSIIKTTKGNNKRRAAEGEEHFKLDQSHFEPLFLNILIEKVTHFESLSLSLSLPETKALGWWQMLVGSQFIQASLSLVRFLQHKGSPSWRLLQNPTQQFLLLMIINFHFYVSQFHFDHVFTLMEI